MWRIEVDAYILRSRAPAMRTGNRPRGAVSLREIVQHPDRVADPASFRVRHRAAVRVQWLRRIGFRIGGANVEAAQFEPRTEDMLHAFKNLWRLNDPLKNFAFVDPVGAPPGMRLLFEFGSGLVPCSLEQFVDSPAHLIEQHWVHQVFKDEIAVLIELEPLGFGHASVRGYSRFFHNRRMRSRRNRSQQTVLPINQCGCVVAGDFEIVTMRDGVGGAGFHAVAAKDAAVIVDVIDGGVTPPTPDTELFIGLRGFDVTTGP